MDHPPSEDEFTIMRAEPLHPPLIPPGEGCRCPDPAHHPDPRCPECNRRRARENYENGYT